MSATKDYFIRLAESLFVKNQLGFLDFDRPIPDEYEVEEFEIIKGNYKTIVTLRFNKEGYPVSHGYETRTLYDEERTDKGTDNPREILLS